MPLTLTSIWMATDQYCWLWCLVFCGLNSTSWPTQNFKSCFSGRPCFFLCSTAISSQSGKLFLHTVVVTFLLYYCYSIFFYRIYILHCSLFLCFQLLHKVAPCSLWCILCEVPALWRYLCQMLDMNVFIKMNSCAVQYFKVCVLHSMAGLVPFKGDVPVELAKKSIELQHLGCSLEMPPFREESCSWSSSDPLSLKKCKLDE